MLQQPHCSHRLQTNLGVSQRQASLPHTYSRSPSPLLSPFSPLRLLGVIHLSLSSPPRSLRPSPCPFSSSSSNILPIADGFQLAGLPGAAGWEPPACPPPPTNGASRVCPDTCAHRPEPFCAAAPAERGLHRSPLNLALFHLPKSVSGVQTVARINCALLLAKRPTSASSRFLFQVNFGTSE